MQEIIIDYEAILQDEFCNLPDVLSFEDVRSILVVSENSLLKEIHEKKMKAEKVKAVWKIEKCDMIQYIIDHDQSNVV